MSDTEYSVECNDHGKRRGAFVCRHLMEGSNLGFNAVEDPENPAEHCPDAWCDACNVALDEAGEWTEELMASADIRLVCDLCYEYIRKRNWLQDDGAFERLVTDAVTYLEEKQARLKVEFRIGDYDRYDWDQETGQLVFSHKGRRKVVANIVLVGSVSTRSDTWLWSWANNSLLETVKSKMREVRRYGSEHGLLKLVAAHWNATEHDGWEMTAIAAYLLGAVGAYRTPSDYGFIFMIITDIAWAQ